MTAPRNVNRCTPCLEGAHRSCTGSAGNIGCGCIHAAPAPQHVVPDDRDARSGRCPDGGYCHGRTLAAGSAPCPEGTCLRVRTSGPLSGVFPGDRWPTSVVRADALVEGRERALRPFRELFAARPDTPCRTTWREESGAVPELEVPATECVEVPLDDLRAAFAEAGEPE